MQWLLYRVRLEIDKVSRGWWYEWGKGGSKARHVGDRWWWRHGGIKAKKMVLCFQGDCLRPDR